MATGTRLMQEISDQFLNCKICFENFREPKTLSCLHTFCCDCLQSQYDSELAGRSSRYALYSRGVTCPLCRKKTELPTGGVRRLPDNFLVSNLTNVLAKKTSVKVPPCEICHSVRGRVLEACSKCLDCNKVLCKGCVDMHVSTKVTQQHSLIDLEGEKNIECKIHPEENIRFYCEPCECCICVVCTFQEHKDHDVCSLSDGFNKHKYSLDELLDRSKERMETVVGRLQSIKKYETVVSGVKEKIRDIAISYIAQIRSKERELIKTMEDVYGDKMKELMESKPVLEENVEELQNACNLTDIMLKDKGIELLLLKKELSSKMTHLLDLPLPDVPEYKKYEVTFEPGETVLGNLSFGQRPMEKDILKSNKIEDDLIEAKKKKDEPDLITNCTQTDACNTNEISTSMSADMSIRFSNTNAQTDLTNAAIEELYAKQVEMNKDKKDQSTQNRTKETTPPPDLLPANSFAYTPGRWIRSRKIQTDICSLDFHREMTDREYVHALLVVESYHNPKKAQLSPQPQRDRDSREEDRPHRRMSNASTMTTQEGGSNGSRSSESETRKRTAGRRDAGVNAVCDSITMDTQTPIKVMKDSITLTDAHGKDDKGTSMPSSKLVDKGTATPRVYLEERSTYTDAVSTSDRATSTIGVKQIDKAVATIPVKSGNAAIQVIPDRKCIGSNTCSVQTKDSNMQTSVNVVDRGIVPDLTIEMKYSQTTAVPSQDSSVDATPSKLNILKRADVKTCDRACDAIKPSTSTRATETDKVKTVTTASGTPAPKCVDRDTSTNVTKTIDQWTETVMPQLVSTGVTPPRPATLEVGVATEVINTNDEATCTEVKSFRSMQTETTLVVCDNETITDHPTSVDAQTSVEINTENTEMETEPVDFGDVKPTESHSTQCEGPILHSRETNTSRNRRKTNESQTDFSFTSCNTCREASIDQDKNPQIEATNNHSNFENKPPQNTQEVGTMAISCTTCHHDTNQETGVQTQSPLQMDKCSATSFEFTDDFLVRALSREFQDAATSTESLPYIGLLSEIDVDELIVIPEANFELVSDSESDLGNYDVEMVDSETCTDYLQYVETGTQTLGISENESTNVSDTIESCSVMSSGKGVGEIIKSMVQSDGGRLVFSDGDMDKTNKSYTSDDPSICKHLVSIGINTAPKLTFEKETCTPLRNLYSKGTMTLCVTKLDKSKNTLSPSGTWDRSKSGSREIGKAKSVDKVTMTTRAEHKDIGVVTEKTDIDGRIENCISKLRNVSERLNSPTSRKPTAASFFDKSIEAPNNISNSIEGELKNKPCMQNLAALPINDKTKDKTSNTKKTNENKNNCANADERRKESTLKKTREVKECILSKDSETKDTKSIPKKDATLKKGIEMKDTTSVQRTNEVTSVRKPQPITTLKGRKSVNVKPVQDQSTTEICNASNDGTTYDSKSLPRQFVLNRPRPVKMGSQPLSPSRLPLHRYNSAPDQITSVPPHTISTKHNGRTSPKHTSKSPSPRTSPSKIPITKKLSPTERSTTTPPLELNGQCTKKPVAPDDIWIRKPSPPTQSSPTTIDNDVQGTRPKLRRPLPSITETRTPSTCSETSMASLASTNSITSTVDSSTTGASSKTPTNSTSTPHYSISSSKTNDSSISKYKPSSSISSALTSSMMTSISESLTDSVFKKSSTETIHSAASSETLEENSAPASQKKSGMGFMQRFLGKRKKNQDQQKEKTSSETSNSTSSGVGKSLHGATSGNQRSTTNPQSHPPGASSHLSPHQNAIPPESKSPTTSRKSRPFVQRIFSIQQDNVEEVGAKRGTQAQKVDGDTAPRKSHDCVSNHQKQGQKDGKKTEKEKAAFASSHDKEKVNSKEGKGSKSKKSDSSKSKAECKHGKGAKKK